MSEVAVMGCGSWGTAFALVLADAGCSVRMWGRSEAVTAEITGSHRNGGYLGELELPESLVASTDPAQALKGAEIVVLAVPSQSLRAVVATWRDDVPPGAVLVSLMKGIELGTHARMTEVIAQSLDAGPERIVVVSGPNLALEVAQRQPTACVVASAAAGTAEFVAHACSAGYFRPYTNTDVVGVELGGAVKNVIALAAGIAEGMGFGDSTRATLITRGLAETIRLGVAMGADPVTFAGLAGMGDLVATCASPLSRNRTFGAALGRGGSLADAVAAARTTAEGVKSCGPILDLARVHGVDMPIAEAVVAIVHDGLPLSELGTRLLGRPRKSEGV